MRIASYNVHNLLHEADAERAGATVKTAAAVKALAGTIGALGADVLLLQEVGAGSVLAEINDLLRAPYPYLEVLEGNSPRGIHLGILSREPFSLTSHRDVLLVDESGEPLAEFDTERDAAAAHAQAARFQRDLMLAEVALADGEPLALFNVHLKSKTNRPWKRLAADTVRAAEARQIRRVVGDYLQKHPARAVILGGDFNDTRSSDALAPLFDLPLFDPLGEMLARTGRKPTTYWPKRRMRLDFLLLSTAARSLLDQGSARIHVGQRAQRASDHYPVSIDLRLPAG
ncbi:MAG TPA: endonuclease/exonuclease/phosphatase family protein [Pseudomonadales bacterium]